MSDVVAGLMAGLRLAAEYNPVFAGIFAAVAAALCARQGRPGRMAFGVALLVVGWLVGDGLQVISLARDLLGGAGALLPDLSLLANWAALAVWAVAGAGIAYAAPAWAGAYVGWHVTFGTGWLAAAAVSATVSALVAMLVSGGVG